MENKTRVTRHTLWPHHHSNRFVYKLHSLPPNHHQTQSPKPVQKKKQNRRIKLPTYSIVNTKYQLWSRMCSFLQHFPSFNRWLTHKHCQKNPILFLCLSFFLVQKQLTFKKIKNISRISNQFLCDQSLTTTIFWIAHQIIFHILCLLCSKYTDQNKKQKIQNKIK